ncbi:BRCT domain-containing protein [Bacteroides sp.]|uniref:BRCT domain-containing protein n=1 Tax=Bacteroides sp. TaxID=29523 RepID=UPI002606B80D|nr:BRCT domain-containing protein [Bacteroides sp.]MDD3040902.1 BRCT domain-containing protein [Bacteroides sp.]
MATNNIAGKSFCITGTLRHSRKQYVNFIKEHGGRFVREVSGKVDYVLRGECCGEKEDKADELGIPFISESEFYTLAGVAGLC